MAIYTAPNGKSGINDGTSSPTSTHSSQAVDQKLDEKADKIDNGNTGDILVKNADGGYDSSGKTVSDFASNNHGHNATSIPLDITDFGGVLNSGITSVQKLADFIDDNIGFRASILFGSIDPTIEGNNGDLYINTTSYDIFHKSTNWSVVGNTKGEQGMQGVQGLQGVKGDTGAGIDNITRTTGDGSPGTTDIYTITYTDATTDTFSVYNGSNGIGSISSIIGGTLVEIDSADQNNPIINVSVSEGDISGLDKYTQAEVDAKNALKINIADIRDNLISTDVDKPLSANQGKILKDLIDNINTLLESDDTTLDELQEIVDYIQLNREDLDSLSIASIAGLQTAIDGKENAFTKNTAFNKDFGTTSGTVLEGDKDAEYVKLTGDQTITGANTFSQKLKVATSDGSEVLDLDATGTNDTLIRGRDNGTESFAIYTSSGQKDLHLRAGAGGKARLMSNGGTIGIEVQSDGSVKAPNMPVSEITENDDLVTKEYVDSVSGGPIYVSSQIVILNGVTTFTHNLGVSEDDVQQGRYKVVITGRRGTSVGAQFGDTAFDTSTWGEYLDGYNPRIEHRWTSVLPTTKFQAMWRANTVSINTGEIIYARLIIFKMY